MSIWQSLLSRLGLQHQPDADPFLRFVLDGPAQAVLEQLAHDRRDSPSHVASQLLKDALAHQERDTFYQTCWNSLSLREQQIAALTCLNCTNRQIAIRLGISPQTVKTHLRNLLIKFDLHTKEELRQALKSWDFTEWKKTAN